MKNLSILLVVFAVIFSCKSDQKTTKEEVEVSTDTLIAEPGKTLKQSDGLIAIHGNYLYDATQNAAVLQTPTLMYGIVVNDKVEELNTLVEEHKSEPYEMVPVTIRGRIFKNEANDQEWENKIEIKEILKVSKPDPEENDVIKLGSK
ncbi:hypothetical protein [uncultured Psychroserpens sp.]|uniref:hypothetical protein n=1 Tax=uncultured Psychroserpens sp. TaxID=255436 RepID=UPI002611FA0C|nr:hypothetical protein [uncultured Psychroserpens sp.]